MNDHGKLDHAHHMRRLLEQKLAKVDPSLPHDERLARARAALRADLQQPANSLFELLQKLSDKEGIGEPPLALKDKEEEEEIQAPAPTIFIIMSKKLNDKC
jgi:hypothetical protein